MVSAARIYAETAVLLIVEFGVFFLLLFFGQVKMLSGVLVAIIGVAYMIVVHVFAMPEPGSVEKTLEFVNKRRIAIGIIFFIAVTLIAFVIPFRELNILAVFLILDVLLALLPGKAVFYGRGMWSWSRPAYILTALLGLGFLYINLAGMPAAAVVEFLTLAAGGLFAIIIVAIFAVVVLGLFGVKAIK